MIDNKYIDKIKSFFKFVMFIISGFLIGILLIALVIIYMPICAIWKLADCILKK